MDKPEITLITGSRQVGKTVLLGQLREYLISKGIPQNLIYYYNLDLVQDWEIFQNQAEFIAFLKERSRERKIYIFVDEAQKAPEPARFFKGVYDSNLNIKLILTGSSSLEIKAKFKETLAGRKRIFQLPPFTFPEFLKCKDEILANLFKKAEKIGEINEIDKKSLIRLYKEYATFGGYPRVVLSQGREEKINILKEIYSSYVERDAVIFFEIRNKSAFNRLVKLLAAQIGQLVNIGELSANLGADRHSIERYISALEESFIVRRITPYYKNPRQEIIKAGKIYYLDCGIRNLALETFLPFDERIDRGPVLENAVFTEILFLQRNKPGILHFWRTKQKTEVDFIIERGKDFMPIEVKLAIRDKKIPVGLNNFIDKISPQLALIVNLSLSGERVKVNETNVNFVYPFELRRFIE